MGHCQTETKQFGHVEHRLGQMQTGRVFDELDSIEFHTNKFEKT
jgi:hypothetical protein